MTGRLYEKYGSYYAVLFFKDKSNKKRRKWIPTGYEAKKGNKKKAEMKLDELIEQHRHLEHDANNSSSEPGDMKPLFVEAVEEWLRNKENKIARSTFEGHQTYVGKHILPYFEPLNLRIDEVTPKHIKDYYEYKFSGGRKDSKTGGLNVQSIRKHSAIIKQVLNDAVIAEQIVRNPAGNVPLPKQDKSEIERKFLTGEEANRLLRAFAGHELQAMVYVTLYYGLRRSEALGLRWSAVDFENDLIQVNHTVVKNLSIEYKDKGKSKKSMHTFPLLGDVREVLLELKSRQDDHRRIFKKEYHNSDYIFKWQDGRLYRPDYITRAFQRVLKNHSLPRMRYHDLRHSTASILHDKGWDLKDIQEWLRHADIETTGNIYVHISESRKQTSAKDLDKTFREC